MVDINKPRSQRAIAEEAAEWFLVVGEEMELNEGRRSDFIAWLKRSPLHIEEFLLISALHGWLEDTPAEQRQPIQALVEEARSNVIVLDGESVNRTEKAGSVRFSAKLRGIFAVAASLVAVAIVCLAFVYEWEQAGVGGMADTLVYETAVGEQRSVMLSDGSLVELNTRSRLEVKFNKNSRLVLLTRGEAIFEVADEVDRPFRINAGFAVLEVLGTRFNVYRQSAQTVVTVVEGRVVVSAPHYRRLGAANESDNRFTQLSKGQQVTVHANGVVKKDLRADVDRAMVWKQRRLIFEGDTLATVVRELNRYNRKQLIIEDPVLAKRRISGMFEASRPDVVVAFLENIGGVRIVDNPDESQWLILSELN